MGIGGGRGTSRVTSCSTGWWTDWGFGVGFLGCVGFVFGVRASHVNDARDVQLQRVWGSVRKGKT